MENVILPRRMHVGETTYEGRIPTYRCRKCKIVSFDPETERDFDMVLNSVVLGVEPEADNAFAIRRVNLDERSGIATWFTGLFRKTA
jgi:hypothetical protein